MLDNTQILKLFTFVLCHCITRNNHNF